MVTTMYGTREDAIRAARKEAKRTQKVRVAYRDGVRYAVGLRSDAWRADREIVAEAWPPRHAYR